MGHNNKPSNNLEPILILKSCQEQMITSKRIKLQTSNTTYIKDHFKTFLMASRLHYRQYYNLNSPEGSKIKNIVVILYVVISLSFPAWAKKRVFSLKKSVIYYHKKHLLFVAIVFCLLFCILLFITLNKRYAQCTVTKIKKKN